MQVLQLQESFYNDNQPVSTLLLIQKIYSVGTSEKSDFYELWQQPKQLKTMEMTEVLPDTIRDIFINSNLN